MATSIYTGFAEAILDVAPLLSLEGLTTWSYKAPDTIGGFDSDGTLGTVSSVTGYIIPNQLDKAQQAVAVSVVYNADWYFLALKTVPVASRGILYNASINRAFRIAGTPETNLGFCLAPLEPCAVPT